MLVWLIGVLAWDGCLPVFMAAVGVFLGQAAAGKSDLIELIVVIVCPVLAALVRTAAARRRLARLPCGPTTGRQISLAGAITLLMFFEGLATALLLGGPAPLEWWQAAVGLLAGYLTLLAFALRPPVAVSASVD